MEITINPKTQWPTNQGAINSNIITRALALLDSQEPSKTLWYVISLIAQGVLFLPVPALLIYYFNAPVIIVVITLFLYFANIIAGMGGAGIRVLMGFLLLSVLVHLIMLAAFTF
jgi:hypothetical protein